MREDHVRANAMAQHHRHELAKKYAKQLVWRKGIAVAAEKVYWNDPARFLNVM